MRWAPTRPVSTRPGRSAPRPRLAGISIGAVNAALTGTFRLEERLDKPARSGIGHHAPIWPERSALRPWAARDAGRFRARLGQPDERWPAPTHGTQGLRRAGCGCNWPAPSKPPVTTTAHFERDTRTSRRLPTATTPATNALSVGAVTVGTAQFRLFRPQRDPTPSDPHAMASLRFPSCLALPPSRSRVSTTGTAGLVSNTPLQWVLEREPRQDTLAFQVDIWSARGALPRNL